VLHYRGRGGHRRRPWNPLYEQITLGVILLLAVGGDAWSRLRTTAPPYRLTNAHRLDR